MVLSHRRRDRVPFVTRVGAALELPSRSPWPSASASIKMSSAAFWQRIFGRNLEREVRPGDVAWTKRYFGRGRIILGIRQRHERKSTKDCVGRCLRGLECDAGWHNVGHQNVVGGVGAVIRNKHEIAEIGPGRGWVGE